MIKISYKDKANWVPVNGIVTNWTNYAIKYKNDRVQSSFLAAEVVQDSWNGKESDIQHVKHDAYYFELSVKESEKKSISILKSCSDIQIIDFEMSASETVVNQTYILDTTKSDYIQIDEIESNVGSTSAARYSVKFRTNRTVINKALPVDYTNYIVFTGVDTLSKISSQGLVGYKMFRLTDNEALFVNSVGIQKRTYSSGEWSAVGNTLTTSYLGNCEACGMSSTQVAIVDTNGDLGLYDFDGTDWSLTGNKLSVATGGDQVSLAKVASDEIAIANSDSGELEQFTFSSPNWSSSSSTNSLGSVSNVYLSEWDFATSNTFLYIDSTNNQIRIYRYTTGWNVTNLSATITGNGAVSRLSGSLTNGEVVLADQSNKLRLYDITGSTLTYITQVDIDINSNPYIVQLETDKVSLTEQNSIDSYHYTKPTYYTDYDLLDWSKEIEDFRLDWPDGTRPLARTIDKVGKQAIFYLETSDYDDFISHMKASTGITLNSETILEHEWEQSEIGEGLWKIIFKGITNIIQDEKDLSPNNTYTLSMNNGTIIYDTDYPVYIRIRDVDKVDVEWSDGGIKTLQTTQKSTYEFVYYTDDPNGIISDVNSYNDVTLSTSTWSEIETISEESLPNLFKVTISGVYDLDIDTIYDFPTSGNNLTITLGTSSPNVFYTDYDIELVSEGADKSTINNQVGINTVTKTITKEVKQAKFYMTETNAFDLKEKCELFSSGDTCTLNSATVYEITNSDNIEPNKLGVNLYEIVVNCLMDTTTN